MTKNEKILLAQFRDALVQYENGSPMKDFMDEWQLIEVAEFLLRVYDNGNV